MTRLCQLVKLNIKPARNKGSVFVLPGDWGDRRTKPDKRLKLLPVGECCHFLIKMAQNGTSCLKRW